MHRLTSRDVFRQSEWSNHHASLRGADPSCAGVDRQVTRQAGQSGPAIPHRGRTSPRATLPLASPSPWKAQATPRQSQRSTLATLEPLSDRQQSSAVALVDVVPDAVKSAFCVVSFCDRRSFDRRVQTKHLMDRWHEPALHGLRLEEKHDRPWRGAYTSREFGLGDPPLFEQRLDVRFPHVVDGDVPAARARLARHEATRWNHGERSVGLTVGVQSCRMTA